LPKKTKKVKNEKNSLILKKEYDDGKLRGKKQKKYIMDILFYSISNNKSFHNNCSLLSNTMNTINGLKECIKIKTFKVKLKGI